MRPSTYTQCWPVSSRFRWRCMRIPIQLTFIILFFFLVVYVNERSTYFKPSEKVINPMPFKVLHQHLVECPDDPPLLTIVVLSLHQHRNFRQAIRETWGNWFRGQAGSDSEKVKVVFLLGTNDDTTLQAMAREEAESMRDILMFNFRESYFNLTYKVLMGFKWIKDFCPQTKYVMKVDEDVFVNVPLVLEKLRDDDWNSKIVGDYIHRARADRFGKYKIGFSVYPFLYHVPFIRGSFYFMPSDLAFKILDLSYYFRYVNLEDVFITGILPTIIGGVNYKPANEYICSFTDERNECEFVQHPRIAIRDISPEDDWKSWEKYKTVVNL